MCWRIWVQQLKDFGEMLDILLWLQQRSEGIPMIKWAVGELKYLGAEFLKEVSFIFSHFEVYILIYPMVRRVLGWLLHSKGKVQSWFSETTVILIIIPFLQKSLEMSVHWFLSDLIWSSFHGCTPGYLEILFSGWNWLRTFGC